ncbi:LysR family transcriptional regulator [Enterovirga sp. CN4-39]|uniref:LysR family transcriptional regulator n=1 Tax=Enterovirga sp. CN4-39 TaxID=3400910 RepID=UPI003C00AC08
MDNTPNLARIRYFLAVAEQLSFRGAAEQLHVAQPALSRAVKLLEAELGYPLFERTTRRVTLTPPGALLADEARASLQQLERALRHAGQLAAGRSGQIVIGYSAQAANRVMPKLVMRFRDAVPEAEVGLYSIASDEQLPALTSGRIDVGILLAAACVPPVKHFQVAFERVVAIIPENHFLARRNSVLLKELSELPFVLGTAKRWFTFRSVINNLCLAAGYLPRVVEEADDVPLLLQLVALGHGITLYGSEALPLLPSSLVALPIRDRHANFGISVAWQPDREPPLVQELLRTARALAAESSGAPA